jgi:3-deoxy-D-manno-octulosonic-acid transferase
LIHSLYNIGIYGYRTLIRLASPFHQKAKLRHEGGHDVFSQVSEWRKAHSGKLIWVHCASLGEFEQGRPVIEQIKAESPSTLILLTFFSPSGYEVRKHYDKADFVCYLPLDTPNNASLFVSIIDASAAVFVKYEFWANYFLSLKKKNVPLYVVSAIFRADQRFFGWQKGFWGRVLKSVDHFFVQNERSAELLNSIGLVNYTVCGDTRFDRVLAIANQGKEFAELQVFSAQSFVVILGSSWPAEEELIAKYRAQNAQFLKEHKVKFLIVPHELTESHLNSISSKFPMSVRWTERGSQDLSESEVLVLDTMGMLSSVYRYGQVAMIGGGFGKGIHNTLEAAVWGIPVIFGPAYRKFEEAIGLIDCGGGESITDLDGLENHLNLWIAEPMQLKKAGKSAGKFVSSGAGATEKVMNFLRKSL